MNRRDLVSMEQFLAAAYRREAKARKDRYPDLAKRLEAFAAAHTARAEEMRCGPLFRATEEENAPRPVSGIPRPKGDH